MVKKASSSGSGPSGSRPKKFKKRRPVPPVVAPAAPVAVAVPARPAPVRTEPAVVRSRPGPAVPVVDYHYVLVDLKRIGLTSGAIVAILVALTFLLR